MPGGQPKSRRSDHDGAPPKPMRRLILLIPLLAGCAQPRPASDAVDFNSPNLERCLQYWTANYSSHPVNHFYVCATDLDQGDLVEALVYWREAGRLLDYVEVPRGAEAQAWRLRPKVDREALATDEDVSNSNHVVPRRVWLRWINQCITDGKAYVVPLKQAREVFPKLKPPRSPAGAALPPADRPAAP